MPFNVGGAALPRKFFHDLLLVLLHRVTGAVFRQLHLLVRRQEHVPERHAELTARLECRMLAK